MIYDIYMNIVKSFLFEMSGYSLQVILPSRSLGCLGSSPHSGAVGIWLVPGFFCHSSGFGGLSKECGRAASRRGRW